MGEFTQENAARLSACCCVSPWPSWDGCEPHSAWLSSEAEGNSHSLIRRPLFGAQLWSGQTGNAFQVIMVTNFRLQSASDHRCKRTCQRLFWCTHQCECTPGNKLHTQNLPWLLGDPPVEENSKPINKI